MKEEENSSYLMQPALGSSSTVYQSSVIASHPTGYREGTGAFPESSTFFIVKLQKIGTELQVLFQKTTM